MANQRNGRKGLKAGGPTAGQRLMTVARSEAHEAGLDLFPFFESMINPEDVPPHRIPDDHGGRTAVFKTPFVVDLPFSGIWNPATAQSAVPDPVNPTDGYSEVILVPGTANSIFVTAGVLSELWDVTGLNPTGNELPYLLPILISHPLDTDTTGGLVQLVQGLRIHDGISRDVAILPKLSGIGASIFECEFNNFDDPVVFDVNMYFRNLGSQVNLSTAASVTILRADLSVETVTISVTSNADDITAFRFTHGGLNIVAFSVAVADLDAASHWVFGIRGTTPADINRYSLRVNAHSACNFTIYDAPELDVLSETLSERTSSLTGLITYMGSTLQDGGQISAARLGMGLSPLRAPAGDVYKYLASLPFYNDDYPLRDGIYAWWLPDSLQEHFYRPYKSPRSDNLEYNSVLQFSVLRDNPDQAIRLKVIQNVEVITRSRLYTSTVGPVNPTYATMIGAMKSMPAVTINSRHKGILSRAMGWLKGWISKPNNWKRLIRTGSSVISKLAPGSLPARIAGGISSAIG